MRTRVTLEVLLFAAGAALPGLAYPPAGPAAELYDPSTGAYTGYAGGCRTAVLRPDGRVTIIWLSEAGGGDGLVLFTGGNDRLAPGTSAALYDPSSGLVAPTGMTNVPSSDEAMVLLPDETALVDGGGTAEIYDPSRGA
jgi:hypothetical protein